MDIEAKVTGAAKKTKWWIFEWDQSKYKIVWKRLRPILIVLFAFFLGYTLLAAMQRAEIVRRSELIPPVLINIPSEELMGMASLEAHPNKGKRHSETKVVYSGPQVIYREVGSIPPGTMVKARLLTGASDGPVRAKLVNDIIVNGERVIESESIILGSGSSTEDRLLIRFDRLVKKDGTAMPIQAQAFDGKDRIAGLRGNKVSTEMSKLAAGIGLNFVGGMSDALQETEVKGGMAVKSSSMKNALLNGAARAALDQSKYLISSYKDKAARIEVEKSRVIYIMFDGSSP